MQNKTLDADTYSKTFDLSHFFIKFIDAEFADNFLKKGELHFEPFVNFRKNNDGESGDPNEGAVALEVKKTKMTLSLQSNPNPYLIRDYLYAHGVMQYANETLEHFGLTSMFYINQLDGLEVEEINSVNYPYENVEKFEKIANINKKDLDQFSSFLASETNTEKVPFLIFPQKFIERIKQRNIKLLRDRVTYYDIHDVGFFESMRGGDIIKTLFVKTNNYSHQKEYRFVLPEKISKKGKNITLGNLEDIAIRLSFEDLYNLRAYYKDQKLD
ncbi:hypothetical protein FGL83_00355 [Leuconostoc lactis]|uniref:Uncharacterized protein n=1 Tax=Leuconostoc lactis TaxID=1246 RepID=A0AAP9EAI2_LEULA|nr:hypothetical protein [Leuconostoc lactis]QEA43247.1 hypothetical protein FGL83_00355 [Leuconostoc lactis]